MIPLKSFILRYGPFWLQNIAITIYNALLYRRRNSDSYAQWREYFKIMEQASKENIEKESSRLLAKFLAFAIKNSNWYQRKGGTRLNDFSPLEKTDLLEHLDEIATVEPKDALVSLTGGTTGASMKVYYTQADIQQRFALLDQFRASFGYNRGERVAWFSGKQIASAEDIKIGRCYRDDFINKIRFFSTFHINEDSFGAYWDALERFKPRFMVGFPSSMFDIATIAKMRGLVASYKVTVVFPTAETLLPIHREVIGGVFNTRLVDQYASSEGAPFILECDKGQLHLHPLSGVFEVVDDRGEPAREGELLITSFTTHGTPLIRYRIGDRIKLAGEDKICACGSVFPIVEWIDGRVADHIWSPEHGRINAVNFSNATKDIQGIRCFQVIQNTLDAIDILVVSGLQFDDQQEQAFLRAVRARVGDRMIVNLTRVADIPREKSGKFRILKNSLVDTRLR